jgi:hypothetical protein
VQLELGVQAEVGDNSGGKGWAGTPKAADRK